ncbi:hypothetical protein CLOP_g22136 [Closterium sp. NIES-67]|nr:hypothetical protein CLOP_g22136 [Closterium sp. NIES-67]
MAASVRLHDQVIASLKSTILRNPPAVSDSPSESSFPVILGWLVGPSASFFSSRDPRPTCSVLSCILVDPRFRDVALQQRGDSDGGNGSSRTSPSDVAARCDVAQRDVSACDVAKSEARALLPLLPGGLTVVGVAVRGEFTPENQALLRAPIAEFRRIFHDVALARRPFMVTWTSVAFASSEIPLKLTLLAGIELRRDDVAAADWWGQDLAEKARDDEDRERIGSESEGDEGDGREEGDGGNGREEGRGADRRREETEADVAWEIAKEEEGTAVEVEVVATRGGKGDVSSASSVSSAPAAAASSSGATGGEENPLEEEFWAAHCPLVCDVAATLPLFIHDKQTLSSSLSASLSAIQADVTSPLALWLLHPPQPPSAATSASASSTSAASATAAGAVRPFLIGSLPNGRAPGANGSVTRGRDGGGSAEGMVCGDLLTSVEGAGGKGGGEGGGKGGGARGKGGKGVSGGGGGGRAESQASKRLASTTRVSLLLNQSPAATSAAFEGQKSAAVGLSYTPAAPSIHLHQISLSLSCLVFAPRQLSLRAALRRLVVPGLLRQVKAVEWMVGGGGGGGQDGEGGRGGAGGGQEGKRNEGEGGRGKGGRAITPTDGARATGDAAKEAASAVSFQLGLKFRAYHFLLPSWPHPLTVLYPLTYGEGQQSLVDMRSTLHQRLGLPLDRPMLRIASALSLSATAAAADDTQAPSKALRLWDVHVGLPRLPHSTGSRHYLVQGSYEYYHYMQDRIDDSGWGCAYRSLQTIVSWLRIQQYTSLPVPSHRRIQEALVELGDKEPSFVGSSQWIGAIELSFILDHLLGVTCKVLTVSSGADMPSKGRQLAHHFTTQGTPVMIGGGVLAYTLLGVDYDEATGECAFLILDPHYTGGEDIKTIRSGGWVAWRKAKTDGGADFFVRDAFYNLLLPQRPATV